MINLLLITVQTEKYVLNCMTLSLDDKQRTSRWIVGNASLLLYKEDEKRLLFRSVIIFAMARSFDSSFFE